MVKSLFSLLSVTTSRSSIKSEVLDLKTLPIFSPFKISVTYTADLQVILIIPYQL